MWNSNCLRHCSSPIIEKYFHWHNELQYMPKPACFGHSLVWLNYAYPGTHLSCSLKTSLNVWINTWPNLVHSGHAVQTSRKARINTWRQLSSVSHETVGITVILNMFFFFTSEWYFENLRIVMKIISATDLILKPLCE